MPASGRKVDIPTYRLDFPHPWSGAPISESLRRRYGPKRVVNCDGEPLFAELASLRYLHRLGWSGVWVDDWGKNFWRSLPQESSPCPPAQWPELARRCFEEIKEAWGRRWSGWWDLFAWKDGEFLFAEIKWTDKHFTDKWTHTQLPWLEAAVGVVPSARFAILECAFSGEGHRVR